MKTLRDITRDYLRGNLSPDRQREIAKRICNGDAELLQLVRQLEAEGEPLELNESDEQLQGISTEAARNDLSRNRMIRVATLLCIVLLIAIILLQWRILQLHEQNAEMAYELQQQENRQDSLSALTAQLDGQYQNIRNVLSSENARVVMLPGNGDTSLESALLMWDTDSERLVLLVNRTSPGSPDQLIQLWAKNDAREWNIVGRFPDDSETEQLYNSGNAASLAHAREVEMRMHGLRPHQLQRSSGQILSRVEIRE